MMNYYEATNTKLTENQLPYPQTKVLMHYSLGGMVGGLLFTLGLLIISTDIKSLFVIIYAIPLGFIIGFIPAGITGMILVKLKQHIHKATDFILVGAIGFSVTFILSSFFLLMHHGVEICSILSITGCLSAVIIASWALPRH